MWKSVLAGGGAAFLLIGWILRRMGEEFRVQSSRLAEEERSVAERVRDLTERERVIQAEIQQAEEEVQEIGQLYDLSKRFLATLEPEQGLQVTGEFLERWIPTLSDSVRDQSLHQLAALMEQDAITPEAVRRFLPLGTEGADTRERWAIAGEQLSLGLQRLNLYRKVQESATHDGLTDLLVRRYFLQRLEDELQRARRRSATAAFLMVDLDRFKEVNDTYGHLVGDVVLREVAQRIRSSVREMDLVGRYGGEEFEVVLPEADLQLATLIADRIRRAVESAAVAAYDEEVQITVSIGVAIFPRDAESPADLIERADEAMYRAKELGRNRTMACSAR